MKLGEFIENFIRPNSLVRLVYGEKSGHRVVLDDWNDVSMEWQILKGTGKNRHYINNEVLGVASILVTRGHYTEAINIVIEELEIQPVIDEMIENDTDNCTTTNA